MLRPECSTSQAQLVEATVRIARALVQLITLTLTMSDLRVNKDLPQALNMACPYGEPLQSCRELAQLYRSAINSGLRAKLDRHRSIAEASKARP
jgi:hypothetical protein